MLYTVLYKHHMAATAIHLCLFRMMLTGIVVATAVVVVRTVRNSALDVSACVPHVRTMCRICCEQMSKHNWNVNIIEEKIKEKIHERGGGTGHYQVLVSYVVCVLLLLSLLHMYCC
jgi:hypothetical protein